MNSHDSHEIGAALERQVADLHDTPFTLADVQGRAHGIRRRRHALVAGAAAAAVAVAVPSVLLLGGTIDRTGAPDPAGPSRSATEAVETTSAPASSVLRGSTLTRPDGTTTELELPGDVLGYTVLTDGRVVVAANGGAQIHVVGADGQPQASYPAEMNDFVPGPTRATAAWVGDDGAVRVLESGTAEPTVLASPPAERGGYRSVDAVLGSGCAAGGCSVLTGDGNTTQHEVTLDGVEPFDIGTPVRIDDVSPDGSLWTYSEQPADELTQYGCVGVYDVAAATTTARSCEVWGISFSPDGRYLESAFAENNMLGDVRVLDLSLDTVLAVEPGEGEVVSATGWASPDSLLVTVAGIDDNQWSLLEVPVDGSEPTTLEGPFPGDNPEFTVELRPSL